MMSTQQMQPLELSEDRLDKPDLRCGHAGVLSEHLIKRYDVQERHPKGKMSPALHNTDLEQKKPRRKDTPALHMSPFAAGVTLLRDERPKVITEDDEKDGDKIAI
ncbi:protein phosphatase 1 regulatory subunit 17 isoform X2 [Otolemur garnettii]|uniref:protein phosphatase 1 regulatory subunit 17 isoform X2 n=1 Tax=Otolemur garnettii TaxID=30611 RepID=UPI0006444EC8|nr:protein phosphatase 1 regulatory subunit 17 isoform X2 [Otolemur garnettii]